MKILSFGHALPEREVANSELVGMLDTSDEWIQSHTGIRSRHIMSGEETLSVLGERAARMALERAGVKAHELDYILCSTTLGEMTFPATACLVQARLGAQCPAVDMNAGCSGFLYALDMAEALLQSGRAKKLLVVAAEQATRLADWRDRSTCVLFGDAVGAAVLEPGDDLLSIRVCAHGNPTPLHSWADSGNCPFAGEHRDYKPLTMNGQEIFMFAVSHACQDIDHVLKESGVTAQAVDYFVLHQANGRILDSVRTRLKQPAAKFPVNIDTHGNTSSACIPVLLSEMVTDGRLQRGQTLVLSAFGAGLTNGAAVLRY